MSILNKKIAIVLSIVLFCWVVVLSVDNIRAENDQAPVFCVEFASYDDGGSIQYVGLLYQVYHVRNIENGDEPMVIDYGYYVVPWLVSLDYLKAMLEIE